MSSHNIFKLSVLLISLVFLLNGCGATRPGTSSGRRKTPAPASRQAKQKPASQTPSLGQAELKTDKSSSDSEPASAFGSKESPGALKVNVDYADVQFVQLRLREYENKFEHWLGLYEMSQEGKLAVELTTHEKECVQKLEHILTGYSLLLESMQQDDSVSIADIATVDPKEMQKLDITFLESRCGDLLALEITELYDFVPKAAPVLSFEAAQKVIASQMAEGNYQEALFAYGRLSQNFPDQKPSLATQLNHGLALQYSGQVSAAAKHFNNMLESGDLSIEPLSLQREIADLFLASGNIAAAESYYQKIILTHESIGAEKSWADEQLDFLRTMDPGSEDMIAYMKFLREYQMYDYRIYAPQLNEAMDAFVTKYAGSPVAGSVLRLKTFAEDRLQSWFDRQMVRIDFLIAEKRFTEATDILKSMTRYYLPAELQAIVQNTYYEVSQAGIQEVETQRHIQELELTEQWDAAVNLLDSQRYDIAISAFESLMGTEYEEMAKVKIREAANQAAGRMRKEAASLFIKAGKTPDIEQKKELLLASHGLLTEILARYPQTDLREKVQQNIAILEGQIQRFDPELQEELQQENPAARSIDPTGTYTRQLQ